MALDSTLEHRFNNYVYYNSNELEFHGLGNYPKIEGLIMSGIWEDNLIGLQFMAQVFPDPKITLIITELCHPKHRFNNFWTASGPGVGYVLKPEIQEIFDKYI